ncbi:MAG: molybdopterin-dependent oxidoreductase [Ilumatobacteraceae bacterium]
MKPALTVPEPVAMVGRRLSRWREGRLDDPRHSDRVAAILGALLGVSFLVCFLTGLLSHLIQHPPSWFSWTTRPAGLYRVTQGLHVATGVATIPLLFAKLWSVFPRLFRWPVADNALHAIERLSLLLLIGGSLFMVTTGVANIELWYPWVFFFPAGHYAVSFVVMGSLVIHATAKWATTRRELRRHPAGPREPALSVAGRRRFLGAVGATSAALVVATVGQTVSPLRKLSILAPRRPDIGVQGFPVNRTAVEAGVTDTAQDPGFALAVETGGETLRTFTLTELGELPQRSATLPISCVEGWSTSQTWDGVPVRDILDRAGAPAGRSVRVESLEGGGRYRSSDLTPGQIDDADTILAMRVKGEQLHVDHGFPLRLIAPNRPGVLQTKWVVKLVVS